MKLSAMNEFSAGVREFVCLLYVSTGKIWKTSGQGEASRVGVPLSLGIYWEEGKAPCPFGRN